MAHQLFQLPKPVNISSNLTLLGAAKALFQLTGTTTNTPVYQDSALTTPHTNPVVADSAGVLPAIYMDPAIVYKVTLKTSADVTLYTADPANDQLLSQAIIGGLLYPRTDAEIAAGVTPVNYAYTANMLMRHLAAFTSDSTDCTTALQDLLAVLRLSGEQGVLPGGIARYTSTPAFDTDGLTLVGNSTVKSVLKKVGNFVGLTITADCTLRNFTLDSAGGADASAGITIRTQARVDMRDIIVQNQGSHGIWLQQTSLSRFENIQCVSNAGDGMRLDASVAPVDANSFVIGNTFLTIDTRGNGGIGFHLLDEAFSNFCLGIVAQNNTGHGIKLDNARGNYILGYSEANTGDPWHLTSDAECRGNECVSLEGSFVDNSPSGGIYNTLKAVNRAGTYDQYVKRMSVMNLIIPDDAWDGNQYQGTLALKHTANRQFDVELDGFAGSQSVRFRNLQSGGIDLTADRMNAATYYLTGANNFITSGTGSPEGVVTAPIGSGYLRTDGGAGTTFYVKEAGAGNTGWVGK